MKYFVGHDHLVYILKQKLKSCIKPDVIVGISKGGMVPAVYAAYHLGVPLTCMGVKSYNKHEQTYFGEITQYPVLPIFTKNILVIDDINDTGYTFRFVDNYLRNAVAKQPVKPKINFLSIFGKRKTTFNSMVCEIVPDDQWVVFPWDV